MRTSNEKEVYDTELGYGEYVVGTDIPEGTYEVTLQSGYGSFQTEDPDNSIYLYGYFSENASDEDEDKGGIYGYCRFYGSDGCRSMGKLVQAFYKLCSMY